MAYYNLNRYDADVHINNFLGMMQYGDGMNGDVRYATDEENIETPAGVLQPQAAIESLSGSFNTRIETLAHLYRRWYTGSDSKDVLIAATGGKLYYRLATTSSQWAQLPFPQDVTAYQCNVWSWVAYEINPEGATSPIDVLLLSNAQDGMIYVRGDDFTVTAVETPKKFGVIERYAERIWGGAIPDDPDMLVYSTPFDPTDWRARNPDPDPEDPWETEGQPEDGAGDIQQPSWDGDSFTALKCFGSQLISFKKHRVWRILGTDPGEYTFKEQFGGGAPFVNTVAVDVERIFMVEKDGISVYDGLSVDGYARQNTELVWRTINKNAMDQMCAALFKERYYLAYPTGTSTVNNEMMILNLRDGTVLRYTGISIESFLVTDDALLATSSVTPGVVYQINWDSWATGTASAAATKWVTPWMDFGYKKIQKGGFDLYFTPEVQDDPVTLIFSIQTEKKVKTKKYTVQPLSSMEKAAGKNPKQKRLHFGGTGRRFRLIIETASGSTAPWRLLGGVQLLVETDPD